MSIVKKSRLRDIWANFQVWIIFLVLLVVYSIISPDFFTPVNLKNIFTQNAMPIIVSMAQLLAILTGGIDLSVSAVLALSGVMAAKFIAEMSIGIPMAILLAMLVGGMCGVINGFLISKLKFAPFIATLATTTMAKGMMYIQCSGRVVYVNDPVFVSLGINEIFGIPVLAVFSFIVVFAVALVLRFTVPGRKVYALGGNAEAARLAGINVSRYTFIVYVLSGVLCGLAGALAAARIGGGSPTTGAEWEMDAIASVVVGGASLSGGVGTPLNTLLGALIIGWIRNILNLMGVAAYPQLVVKGLIIILSVFSQSIVSGAVRLPQIAALRGATAVPSNTSPTEIPKNPSDQN